MNILQPQIIQIGTRRYRKNPFTLSFQEPEAYKPYEEETEDMYIEKKSDKYYDQYEDETCVLDMKKCSLSVEDEDYKDIEFSNGFYKYDMKVAESYFGFIIGRNGEKKSNLERDTQTTIRIPRKGQGNDLITIEGNDRKSVASCRNRLILLIIQARHQKPFTHLLTFPLKFEQLKHKFKEFEDQVLRTCSNDRRVHESIFQLPNKLHLTICTLTLLSEHEVDEACSLLEECRRSFIKDLLNSKQLKVRIKGLEYMNDDPSDVDVLYAKIEQVVDANESSKIQLIADNLMQKFIDYGLSKKQFDRVKLHATVMNTLRRQDQNNVKENVNSKNSSQRESFDARNILKLFGDFDFGIYTLNEIHLSHRYSAAADGYYECISSINI